MEFDNEIYESCRTGEIDKIQYLVEELDVDVNVRDHWGSTPLYYACHCGNIEAAKYLIRHGARCEAHTFDGERCYYSAYNDDIKEVLLRAKILTPLTKRRDDYGQFCEKMMKSEEHSDVTFNLNLETPFKFHRCILSCRSEFMRNCLQGKWRNKEVDTSSITPGILKAFISYVYTGRMTCTIEMVGELSRLGVQCNIPSLKAELVQAIDDIEFYESTKNGFLVTTVVTGCLSTIRELQREFRLLIELGIPSEFSRWPPYTALPMMSTKPEAYFDMCFCVEGYRFECHKLFLSVRSSYFSALIEDHFQENELKGNNYVVINIRNISPPVLTSILYYVYSNNPSITDDIIFDLLEASDLYLLPGLTRLCGHYLCDLVETSNVVSILRIARLHRLYRLEHYCGACIAKEIDHFVEDEEFQEFVVMDAKEVKKRQKTGSIQIIDEVRYEICNQVYSKGQEANDKLQLIDSMLEKLGLKTKTLPTP